MNTEVIEIMEKDLIMYKNRIMELEEANIQLVKKVNEYENLLQSIKYAIRILEE